MPVVTLHDVCRESGVSLATVDRVLNGRAGVKPETVARVRAAVERLGYRANPFASRLARGRTYHIAFVLPEGDNPFVHALAAQAADLATWLAPQGTLLELFYTPAFDPAALASRLNGLAAEDWNAVAIVALDHPLVRGAIDGLAGRGVHVATLVSDAPASRRTHYVGIDNVAAGRTAATLLGRFHGSGPGKVGVILGSPALRDHLERHLGFCQALAQHHPQLAVLPYRTGRDDEAVCAAETAALLAEHPDLAGLYLAGAGIGGAADTLRASGHANQVVLVGHEFTEALRPALLDGTIDALITQDPGHEVRSAARRLLADLTSSPLLAEQERIRIDILLADNLP